MKRILIALFAGLAGSIANATDWQMDPESSALTFTATQEGADFDGRFHAFTAAIQFDPAAPEQGRIESVITLASVDTAYADRDTFLKDTDWFNTSTWSEARFNATNIRATASGYVAEGVLNLRGVEKSVALNFQFVIDAERAHMTGTAIIDRLAFGVGQGDWSNTNWVGADVVVKIDLRLEQPLEAPAETLLDKQEHLPEQANGAPS